MNFNPNQKSILKRMDHINTAITDRITRNPGLPQAVANAKLLVNLDLYQPDGFPFPDTHMRAAFAELVLLLMDWHKEDALPLLPHTTLNSGPLP